MAMFDDLLATFVGPPMPAQPRLPVHYDAAARTLELGGVTRELEPDAGNRVVLEQLVELVGEVRDHRPTAARHLGRLDVTAVAAALDLRDENLETDVREALAVEPRTAKAVTQRLVRALPAAPVIAAR